MHEINLYSYINVFSFPCHHRDICRYTHIRVGSPFVFKHNECKTNIVTYWDLGQVVRTIYCLSKQP